MSAVVLRFEHPDPALRTPPPRFNPHALILPVCGALCGFAWAIGLSYFIGASMGLLFLPIGGVMAASVFPSSDS